MSKIGIFANLNYFGRPTAFQVGNKPSGDVFTASPVKGASLKVEQDLSDAGAAPFAEAIAAANDSAEDSDDRCGEPSATASNALIMGASGDRAYRAPSAALTPSSHQENGAVDAQVIYPPSACVFVAK